MLLAATLLLGAAILAGLGLVVRLSLGRVTMARWPAALHGLLGALGFVALLLGLRGPGRGVRMGAGSFGVVAAGFLAATLMIAATIVLAQWRRRAPPGLAIALHATLAVGGFVMLVAYFSMPPG
jgi:hypothetical protein